MEVKFCFMVIFAPVTEMIFFLEGIIFKGTLKATVEEMIFFREYFLGKVAEVKLFT